MVSLKLEIDLFIEASMEAHDLPSRSSPSARKSHDFWVRSQSIRRVNVFPRRSFSSRYEFSNIRNPSDLQDGFLFLSLTIPSLACVTVLCVMNFFPAPNFEFAVRCFEIEQKTPGRWQETPGGVFPKPPRAYRVKDFGYDLPWQRWTAIHNNGLRLRPAAYNEPIRIRETTTLVWCQESQSFWVAPFDFTDRYYAELGKDPDNYHDWTPLYFDQLRDDQSPAEGGIYQIAVHGRERQLNYPCPAYFDEYLPINKFIKTSRNTPIPCQLIGRLSLILGLHAMCPQETHSIEQQFNVFFWENQQPVYTPAVYNNLNERAIRDKDVVPGRALVVQTGVFEGTYTDLHEAQLRDWERGVYGPMVASW